LAIGAGPVIETSSGFAKFVLSKVRIGAARARLTVVEIDDIGVALAGNFISANTAVA